MQQFRGVTQLNSNIYNKSGSAWVVFKGVRSLEKSRHQAYDLDCLDELEAREDEQLKEDVYQPIASSNPRYSFHPDEIPIIDALRRWSKEYFSKFQCYDHEIPFPPDRDDFDLFGYIHR